MIGETIKWRMKIANLSNVNIYLGIGLRTFSKNNYFAFTNFTENNNHGCYVLGSDRKAYAHLS